MTEDAVPENVKHLSAHMAIEEQPSIALSQGFAVCGQQSMSSIADMSAVSVDFTAAPTTPAAGRMATDKAIRNANIVRPTFMGIENSRFGGLGVK
jgi:hypothetical protein